MRLSCDEGEEEKCGNEPHPMAAWRAANLPIEEIRRFVEAEGFTAEAGRAQAAKS